MHGRVCWLMVLVLSAGCQGEEGAPPPPVADSNSSFDVARAGAIKGSVTWLGDVPLVPTFKVHAYLDNANTARLRGEQPNPHAPKVDPVTGGIDGAVVLLRAATAPASRPWPHAPVRVEFARQCLKVVQESEPRTIGFVRRGAEFECVNLDVTYHSLRARGAAFFTLPLVAAEQRTGRRLDDLGLVELSSGASCYWQRAYLFVLDHPYATLTGATGDFVMDQVPAGTYRLALWMPNWHVASQERDPETAAIRRITFAPPVELEQEVTAVAGQATSLSFVVGEKNFVAGASATRPRVPIETIMP